MNSQDFKLVAAAETFDSALYKVFDKNDVEVFISSDSDVIDILNRPECLGIEFQTKLSRAIRKSVELIYQKDVGKITSALRTSPIDVFYLLRGGLNYDLHRSLAETVGLPTEVSFLSSQRVENEQGFEIGEASYHKWSIQDHSILCIGDICATGTTIKHSLDRAIEAYSQENKRPKRLFLVTIGTLTAVSELVHYKNHLMEVWAPIFEGITVLCLEGIFRLHERNSLLTKTHLSFTDFFRKDIPRSLQFELKSLKNPICFLERCAIYDGGSRAFEPKTYFGNLINYWRRMQAEEGMDVRTLLSLKSDLLDYQLSFDEWKLSKPWWQNGTEQVLKDLYELGGKALESLLSLSLKQVSEKRLSELMQIFNNLKMDKKIMENTKIIDKLAWINISDRHILSTKSKGKDTYYIPGGKREVGETDEVALIREIKEELSIDLIPHTLQYVGTFEAQAHGKDQGVIVRMTCYSGKFEGEMKPAAEVEEMVWFEHKDRERSSPVDKIIFDWLKEQNLID